jgi:hypothetical protein
MAAPSPLPAEVPPLAGPTRSRIESLSDLEFGLARSLVACMFGE